MIYIYQIAFSLSIFVFISLGLAVIFGMMRVINLAQGEFIMLGAYACGMCSHAGLPLWLAIPASAAAVGLFGILVERTVIRFLYGRLLDTLLATWGLSLLLVGAVTTLFGPQSQSVPVETGSVDLGGYQVSGYSLFMIGSAVLLLAGTYALWRYSRLGLIVRGTMQNPDMARALGIKVNRVYMFTFGFGSAITGLAGALLVPVFGAAPTMGLFYVAKAFIAVIAGGHLPLLGTISAAGLFGAIDGVIAYAYSSVLGEIAVLLVAILLLRLLPRGITGHLRRGL